jgi:flavodoxin
MISKKQWFIIGGISVVVVSILTIIIVRYRKKSKNTKNEEPNKTNTSDKTKNIIIGDSQTKNIAKNTKKAQLISSTEGEKSLWQSSKNLSWLKKAVDKYKKSPDINSVIINIGTNGGFSLKDNVKGLVASIKEKFPNAKLYAVQGSWGWGGNGDKTIDDINKYYDKFRDSGVKVLEPPIGKTLNPHNYIDSYKKISKSIDNEL